MVVAACGSNINYYNRGCGYGCRAIRGGRTNGCRQTSSNYCLTHGNCSHTSAECNTMTARHNDTATLQNIQTWETNGC